MREITFEKIKDCNYDVLLAENIEEILSGYLITNHDNMILDIMREIKDFYD
jgi:hypothetical protein